jgi:hypothetical protein
MAMQKGLHLTLPEGLGVEGSGSDNGGEISDLFVIWRKAQISL